MLPLVTGPALQTHRLFLLVSAVLAVTFALQAWPLSPLVLDTNVRTLTTRAMKHLEQDRGWLLSDILVQSVSATDMRIIHRRHIRGVDPQECDIVDFKTFTPKPCASAL